MKLLESTGRFFEVLVTAPGLSACSLFLRSGLGVAGWELPGRARLSSAASVRRRLRMTKEREGRGASFALLAAACLAIQFAIAGPGLVLVFAWAARCSVFCTACAPVLVVVSSVVRFAVGM